MSLRALAKDWLPPALTRRLRRYSELAWEGNYNTFAEARSHCIGYDSPQILSQIEAALLAVKRGESVFERDGVLFDEVDYSWPLAAGVMRSAALSGGVLNLVDFGGSLGSVYFQLRALLRGFKRVRWRVIEQPHFVEVGKRSFESEELRFYSSLDSCAEDGPFDVCLFSSVLQYLDNPHAVLQDAISREFKSIVVDRTPFRFRSGDRIAVQHVPKSIYEASYPSWIFDLESFESQFADGFEQVARFQTEPRLASEEPIFFGFLFERR